MEKSLITVGNSKAVILPKQLVDKFQLDQVSIREVEQGILIAPAGQPSFHDRLEGLRRDKDQIYQRMKAQAQESEAIACYDTEALPDIDLDVEDQLS